MGRQLVPRLLDRVREQTAQRQLAGDRVGQSMCWRPYRQAALAEALSRRGLVFAPSIGQLPSNDCPGEDSFPVFGLSLEQAKHLGWRLEQNAMVRIGADAVLQLILLR